MSSRTGLITVLTIASFIVLGLAVIAVFSTPPDREAAPSVTPTVDEITAIPTPTIVEVSPSPLGPEVSPFASPTPREVESPAPVESPTPAVEPTGMAVTGTNVKWSWLGVMLLLAAVAIPAAVLRRGA